MRVAINGFGRIGRAFYKLAKSTSDLDIVAINDLANKKALVYLLKHDSVYGYFDDDLKDVILLSEKEPENLPWNDLGVDIVVESTGIFKTKEFAKKHILAGAKRVVVSAPSDDIKTILVGVNDNELENENITSNASCTTNALSPVFITLDEKFSVQEALLTTIHSYTATQSIVDSFNKKDFKRGRAAALNIIPTTTGAAQAFSKVKNIKRFNAKAVRVPTPAGSLIDLTLLFSEEIKKSQINEALKESAEMARWRGIFDTSDEPLVSTDIIGRPKASIVDLSLTVTTGKMVKVFIWYDNEIGYTKSLLEHVIAAGEYL